MTTGAGVSFRAAFPRRLAAGLVLGAMGVSLALSFATLVFYGDLAPELGRGAGWALASFVVLAAVTALTSSFRGLAAGVQDAPTVIIGAAAVGLVATAEEPMATLAAFIILTTAFTGALLLVMGHFRLGGLVRYVPFPVVAGFLGGTGVVLTIAGADILIDAGGGAAELGLRTVPGLLVALLLVALGRGGRSSLASVVVLAVGFVGYHVAAAIAGIDRVEGMARSLLLGPFPTGSLADLGVIAELWSADWGAVFGQLPAVVVMAMLVPLGLLLNTGALEHTFKVDIDVDRELLSTGAGLMLAAPFAGLPGYVILGDTVIGRRIGGASRIPPLIAAVIGAVVLAVGADVVSLLPVFIPGGLLLGIGLDFLLSWVWDIRHRVGLVEHAVIIGIVAAVAVFGFIQGVGLGVVAATVLFVFRYSKTPAVRAVTTARVRRSNVQRNAADEATLVERGDRAVVMELQGFLFFGSAEQLVKSVREGLRLEPHIAVVILDFRRVTGMDSSVAASFDRLGRMAEEHQLEVTFCGADPEMKATLQPTLDHGFIRYEVDLDHALETYEEEVLGSRAKPLALTAESAVDSQWEACPAIEMAAGDLMITEGEQSAGVFYLESGRASVVPANDDMAYRRAVLLPGSVIGELSHLTGQPANSTVVCDTECVVRHFTEEWFVEFCERDPVQALALQRLIAARLAEKLTAANRTIRSLL
ncbi:MAG: SulP family inorganic anion transporter [Acidimicrobiia bacterium]